MMVTMRYIVTVIFLSACSWNDIKKKRINKCMIAFFLAATVLLSFVSGVSGTEMAETADMNELNLFGINRLIFDMIPGLICIVLSCASKQSLGLGDSLLILITGMAVGYWSCFSILLIAVFGSILWAGYLYIKGKASWKTEIPFVPFLLVGTIVEWAYTI